MSGVSIILIIVLITYNKLSNNFDDSNFKEKYGTILEGVNTEKQLGAYWNVIVLLRWTLTSVIMVMLRDFYALQICSLLLLSYTIQLMVVLGKPLEG